MQWRLANTTSDSYQLYFTMNECFYELFTFVICLSPNLYILYLVWNAVAVEIGNNTSKSDGCLNNENSKSTIEILIVTVMEHKIEPFCSRVILHINQQCEKVTVFIYGNVSVKYFALFKGNYGITAMWLQSFN